MTNQPRPIIVCLCGSARFWREYTQYNASETMAGKIVLSVGFFVHADGETTSVLAHRGVTTEEKKALDELHLRKIDLADEILILNRNGYMGESTRNELKYARAQGKTVRFIEPPKVSE